MLPVSHTPRVIVLDCGVDRTALGVFRRKAGRLCLEKYAGKVFANHAGCDAAWQESTGEAFHSFRSLVRTGSQVILVPPAQAVLTKLVRCPRVDQARREKVIRFEAELHIPYALADVTWDSVVVKEWEAEIEVFLAAIKSDFVGSLCGAAAGAGFQPTHVLPPLLGTLAAFRLARPGLTESSLVLSLQKRSANLLLVESGRFAGRSFSLDGNDSAQPLIRTDGSISSEGRPNTFPDRDAGPSVSGDVQLGIRLSREIVRSVLHYCAQTGMSSPVHLSLTGEGAQLPDLPEVLAAKLKIPVERLAPIPVFEISPGAAASGAEEQRSALNDMSGAVVAALWPGQTMLNLLPAHQHQVLNFRRRQPWLIAAAVALIIALVPPLIYFRSLRDVAHAKAMRIETKLAPLRRKSAQNQAKLQRLEEARRQIAGIEGVSDRRDSWIRLLADLENRLAVAGDAWIERLQVDPEEKGFSLRLLVSGGMRDRANPLSHASPETISRVRQLLADIAGSTFVSAVETPRFDNSQPGRLEFEFVLVCNPGRPL